jgi:hypothetical protein
MGEGNTLRQKAREAIQGGKLPSNSGGRLFAGPGLGACCAICDRPIELNQIEYELDFVPDDGSLEGNARVHMECFLVWESVVDDCAARQEGIPSTDGAPALGVDAALSDGVLPKTSSGGTMFDCEQDTPPG